MSKMTSPPACWVIIPAAGVGSRMQADKPKQYLSVAGKTILEHTLDCFLGDERFRLICIALSPEDEYWSSLNIQDERVQLCDGGKERADSVLNALYALEGRVGEDDWVWVHDAARPCLSPIDVDALFSALSESSDGALLALPVADTIKRADSQGKVSQTVDRSGLWRAFTPQVFRYSSLKKALIQSLEEGLLVTDESSAMEYLGFKPQLVTGSSQNIKVTHPVDLKAVEKSLLERKRAQE